jgi:hypothetical protein
MTDPTLTLPDGAVFEFPYDVQVSYGVQAQFQAQSNVAATAFQQLFDSGGQDGRGDSLKQGAFLSIGSGVHTVEIRFNQFTGSGAQFGGADPDATAITKLQTLNRALTTQRIDSTNPAEFAHEEYSASGQYDPIPVVVNEYDLTQDRAEQTSTISGTMTLIESTDLGEAIDAVNRTG